MIIKKQDTYAMHSLFLTKGSLGDCNQFSVDNSEKLLIAIYPEAHSLKVYDIDSLTQVYSLCHSGLNFKQVWLDETGFMMATLSEDCKAVLIHMFEYLYTVKEPVKEVKVNI